MGNNDALLWLCNMLYMTSIERTSIGYSFCDILMELMTSWTGFRMAKGFWSCVLSLFKFSESIDITNFIKAGLLLMFLHLEMKHFSEFLQNHAPTEIKMML